MKRGFLLTAISRLFRRKGVFLGDLPDLKSLCSRLTYNFTQQRFLIQALKHRSYLAYSGEKRQDSNERLELLGDAVLGLVITDYLYHEFPEEEEGELTNFKSMLVNRKMLSTVARDFDLGQFILLNASEERAGGRDRESILSDAIEAIIGAIYLDGGFETAKKFILDNIANRLDSFLVNGHLRNYKSILQEHSQSFNLKGPVYKVEEERGPDHDKTFVIAAVVDGKKMGAGQGSSKKTAEQKAAKQALIRMNVI